MLRIVPWLCRDEWLETYKNLYNFADINMQIKGITCVEAWKSRSSNKLPLSVEVTASLIAARIQDVQSEVSELVVRHIMAMAIVRFVNSMVDQEQKGAYARSVQSIADEIGIPDWLVDLRHEATHAGLPSLEVLRAGCRFGLDWLHTCYWESQIAEFQERDDALKTLLEKYVKVCENVKSGAKKSKSIKDVSGEIADLVRNYDMWELFLDLSFGEDGLLLITSFETLQIMFPDGIQTTDMTLEIPSKVRQFWSPFLKALQKTNNKFLSNLVSFLVKRIHQLEQHSRNMLLVHLYSCLVHFIIFNCDKQNSGEQQWKVKAEFDYFSLLEVCLNNPSIHMPRLLKLIIDNLEISTDNKDKLYKFSAINVAFNMDKNTNATHDEKAVLERLEQEFPHVADKVKSRLTKSDEASSVWQQCPVTFANSFKFGSFLGSKAPLQIEHLNQRNDESMHVEAGFDGSSRDQDSNEEMEAEFEDDSSESYEDELNEEGISEKLYISGASEALIELTGKTIEDISRKICLF